MLNQLRKHVATKVLEAAHRVGVNANVGCDSELLVRSVGILPAWKAAGDAAPQFCVRYSNLHRLGMSSSDGAKQTELWDQIAAKVSCDDALLEVQPRKTQFIIRYNPVKFSKHVLQNVVDEGGMYGLEDASVTGQAQRVLVEYSSPNIAKPFHAGHLRSTILGNFIANIHTALGHQVTRINYLGDWGTQFGLLGVGFQKYGSIEKLKKNAMEHLFEVYVKINQDASTADKKSSYGENNMDNPVHREGMEFFRRMEAGDPETLSLWQLCKDYSIEEYTQIYKRLGVEFDEYHGEADYHQKSHRIIDNLKNMNLLQYDQEGLGYVDLSESGKTPLQAKLLKSNNTTLYLTRDLAAAIERHEKYQFDRLIYVVENGQHQHFKRLIGVLQKMGYSWADRPLGDFHVKFGLVEGMSTRKGEVVFLKDILDEAKHRMMDVMREKETTRITDERELEEVADVLGKSAVIIQDVKEKRLKNYRFDWNKILRFEGQTGVFLQYTHARLCSLEKQAGMEVNAEDCDYSILNEARASQLVQHLARYDEVVNESFTSLEPYILVQYLFSLGNFTGSALKEHYVKGKPRDEAMPRLVMYNSARTVLASGMRLLGLQPLRQM